MLRNRKSLRVIASYISLSVTFLTVVGLLVNSKAVPIRTGTEKAYQVRTSNVSLGNFETTVSIDGLYNYEVQYPGVSVLGGRVTDIYVSSGDSVKKDQLLFKMETSDYEALLQKAYAQRESNEAHSFTADGNAQQPVLAAYVQRESTLLEEQITQLNRSISLSAIRAACDGYVMDVLTAPGGYLAAGGAGMLLSGENRVVNATAMQKDAAQIQRGMRARLYVNDETVCEGTVTAVGTLVQDDLSGMLYTIVSITPDAALTLNTGTKMKVEIITASQKNVLMVPSEALDSRDRLWQIVDGRAYPIEGAVILAGTEMAWVQGINENAQVVYLPDEQMQPGQRIKETEH